MDAADVPEAVARVGEVLRAVRAGEPQPQVLRHDVVSETDHLWRIDGFLKVTYHPEFRIRSLVLLGFFR